MSFELSVSILKTALDQIHAGVTSVEAAYASVTAQGLSISMDELERAVRWSEAASLSF